MLESMNMEELIKLIAPVIVFQFTLMIFCLVKLKNDKVKYLPKWAWALIIIVFNFVGPIVYLLLGRERD
ncbi:PLD nuclease N-terminal domain-containing protein [Anaerocellum danielii]|uniref:PLD nuclease N-terminal domain-containing protein n=1 Tax=Anaerocellum danielii TaxID=1387557 RepID=A0ABZ0TWM0_9FIRM|nr:PLD nuclease N-terminal domain-containing protein [Caldicellulosiruptor danielii]WPX07851.1 PLD nuclease N-terminal domain-containing protein [Caldicellulosiruptor danielii]